MATPTQDQLFSTVPPQPPEAPDGPIPWIVKLLKPAALELIQTDPDTGNFHPKDQRRIATALARTLAETAEQELMMIAMINGCPPFDDPNRGIPD